MNWGLLIIGVIILFVVKNKLKNKFDEELQESLITPGKAEFLRKNYLKVITYIEKQS